MQKYFQLKKIFLFSTLVMSMMASNTYAQAFGELIPFWDDYEETSSLEVDHSAWQELLTQYVDDQHPSGINRFDYEGVSGEDLNKLEEYLAYMQSVEPRQLNKAEQMAYWINLYNAATVNVVLDNIDDLTSIRQIRSSLFSAGPWQLELLNVVQQSLSLDNIEHGILRPIWRDKRIHYAVNCASLGCPNLLKTAYTAENTEQLLEQAAADFINNKRGVDVSDGDLVLSSIYDWYAVDFGNSFEELIEHISEYADEELAFRLSTFSGADYDYDWSLNK